MKVFSVDSSSKVSNYQNRTQPPELHIPEYIGPYKITGVLAQKSISVSFDAISPLKTQVVVKIPKISEDLETNQFAQYRIIAEAQVLQSLTHVDGIIKLLDSGISNDIPYLVLDKSSNISLLDLRRREPFDLLPLVDLGIGLANTINQIHQAGFIHRNIKTTNVLISPTNQAILRDFGLTDRHINGHLRAPNGWGSPGFTPPEVFVHRQASTLSDQFSLGRVLFELGAHGDSLRLSSKLPVLELMQKALEINWSRLPNSSSWQKLQLVLKRMLSTDASQRYASLTEVDTALKEVRRDLIP